MADFAEKAAVKSAVRKLAAPISNLATFTSMVQDVMDNNLWGCTHTLQPELTLLVS